MDIKLGTTLPLCGGPSAARAGMTANPTDKHSAIPDSRKANTDDLALEAGEQQEIRELSNRDRQVRAHEAAHLSAGGSVIRGGARFESVRGPDGRMYAVGGEVSIDASAANTPKATLAKAEIIRRAALAPTDPSAQDRAIAAQAVKMATEARAEIARQRLSPEATERSLSAAVERYQDQASLSGPSEQSHINAYV